MTIQEAFKRYPSVEIDLLLSGVLGKPREFLVVNPQIKLSAGQLARLSVRVRRRMRGEPVPYILGYKDFCGLRFKVNKDVLIPRPETEWVVERILGSKFATGSAVSILDVGTGSGCIAISLAFAFRSRNFKPIVSASDVSEKALSIAKHNARAHKVKVEFIKSNLLTSIRFDPDIVVANLPYGWHGVKNRFSAVKNGLKFEPQLALYAQEKGLGEIRRLVEQIAVRKKQPKLIYLEFDPRQKAGLSRIIKKYLPNADIQFHRDFNSFWRYAEVSLDNKPLQ